MLDAEGKPAVGKDGMPRTVKKPTLLFHDPRHTAVRNSVRAGIPEVVAMRLSSHQAASIFRRYAIVDEGMLREADDKLVAAMAAGRRGAAARDGQVAALRG